jgi:hypothetical protein
MGTIRLGILVALSVVGFSVLIAFHSIAADSLGYKTEAPQECLVEVTKCIFYPKVEKPHIYDGPTSSTEFSNSWPMTAYSRRPLHYLNDWVADPNDLQSRAQRVRIFHLWSRGVAWVERKDIVGFQELRRVTKCWLIKSMDIENGDAPGGSIYFRPEGLGVVENPSGGMKRLKVAAWFAEGVYSVRFITLPKNRSSREYLEIAWGNLDYKKRHALHRANWISNTRDRSFEGFAEKDAFCENGPIVK